MENSQNIKNTPLGFIPADWNALEIQSFAATSSGGTPSRAIKDYYVGNNLWFTTSELNDGYLFDSIEHISEEALNNSSAKVFPEGTLLIAMYGATIGKLGILTEPASTNQACCAIICSKTVDTRYLFYQLLFNRSSIVALGRGAGQPNISQDIVKQLTIAVPSLIEQQKIADALSGVDDMIGALDEAIAKKRQIKEGLMQQLLTGKTRLPGFTDDWVELRFDDFISRFATGLNPRSNFVLNVNASNYYITIKDFADGVLYFD